MSMTREQAKELIPVMQAYADGKPLQLLDGGKWRDIDEPVFWPHIHYRVRPEPRDYWIAHYKDGTVRVYGSEFSVDHTDLVECVHVREIKSG